MSTYDKNTKIGWLGFGLMGSAAAKKHIDAGYNVYGWNRTSDKVKQVHGVKQLDNISDVVQQCDIVFSSLTNDKAVQDVYNDVIQHVKPNQIFVEMSTIHPDTAKSIAQAIQSKQGHMLDCPISGSPHSISKHVAQILIGGDTNIYDKVKPLLEAIGPKHAYIGSNGLAQVMKLSINSHLALQIAGSAETLLICENNGIDRQTALNALLGSAAASPHMNYRVPYMLQLPDKPLFNTSMIIKDLGLVTQLAHRSNVALPVTSAAHQLCISARAAGYDKQDFAAIYHTMKKVNGNTTQ